MMTGASRMPQDHILALVPSWYPFNSSVKGPFARPAGDDGTYENSDVAENKVIRKKSGLTETAVQYIHHLL
jgi:hypothetical protein